MELASPWGSGSSVGMSTIYTDDMDPNSQVELADLIRLDEDFLAKRISVQEYCRRYFDLCKGLARSEAEAQIIEAAAHRECTIDEAELREQIASSLKQLPRVGS